MSSDMRLDLDQPQDDVAVGLALVAQAGELVEGDPLDPDEPLTVISGSHPTEPSGNVSAMAAKAVR
jgi:hypothetical protein